MLVTRPETWEATFTVGLEGLLLPGERLSLPGAAEALLWVGGDATLERAAATDWEAKAYYVAPVEPFLGALEEAAGVQHREVIIALAELLCLVCLAAHQHASWHARLVLYVTDNDNVRVWVNDRYAKNRMARHLACGTWRSGGSLWSRRPISGRTTTNCRTSSRERRMR